MSKYLDYNGLSYYNSCISPPLSTLINNSGKNLLNIPYIGETRTVNGITFIFNSNGSVTFSGTLEDAETYATCVLLIQKDSPSPSFYNGLVLSGCTDSTIATIKCEKRTSPYTIFAEDTGHGSVINNPDFQDFVIFIRTIRGKTIIPETTFYPMLSTPENFKISKTFVPYRANCLSDSDIDNIWITT